MSAMCYTWKKMKNDVDAVDDNIVFHYSPTLQYTGQSDMFEEIISLHRRLETVII